MVIRDKKEHQYGGNDNCKDPIRVSNEPNLCCSCCCCSHVGDFADTMDNCIKNSATNFLNQN